MLGGHGCAEAGLKQSGALLPVLGRPLLWREDDYCFGVNEKEKPATLLWVQLIPDLHKLKSPVFLFFFLIKKTATTRGHVGENVKKRNGESGEEPPDGSPA